MFKGGVSGYKIPTITGLDKRCIGRFRRLGPAQRACDEPDVANAVASHSLFLNPSLLVGMDAQCSDHIMTLPTEILVTVILHLDWKTILRCRTVAACSHNVQPLTDLNCIELLYIRSASRLRPSSTTTDVCNMPSNSPQRGWSMGHRIKPTIQSIAFLV